MGTTAAVPGWQALFTAKRKGWRVLPVICWATVRRYFDVKVHGLPDTENFVSPIVPEPWPDSDDGTALACESEAYVGLVGPGQDPKEVFAAYLAARRDQEAGRARERRAPRKTKKHPVAAARLRLVRSSDA